MTTRKFHKRIYTVEILSEKPIPDSMDLMDVVNEADHGDYSGDVLKEIDTVINGRQAAAALMKQGSSPEFFGLTKDGDDDDDDE